MISYCKEAGFGSAENNRVVASYRKKVKVYQLGRVIFYRYIFFNQEDIYDLKRWMSGEKTECIEYDMGKN